MEVGGRDHLDDPPHELDLLFCVKFENGAVKPGDAALAFDAMVQRTSTWKIR